MRQPPWHPESARFARISAGLSGLAALTHDGQVYYLNNSDAVPPNPPVRGLLPFPAEAAIIDVAMGFDFVVGCSQAGLVYAVRIVRRPLGGGYLEEVAQTEAVELPGAARAVAVAAGYSHCAALDSDGLIHTWGSNKSGQLGDGTRTNRDSPGRATAFPENDPAVEVHASRACTTVVTASGRVLQVGALIAERRRAAPTLQACPGARAPGFPRGTRVTTMAVGEGHCLALVDDGAVYAWGDNGAWQLGCDAQVRWSARPRLVSGLPSDRQVAQLAAGTQFSLALAADGSACAWGWNEEGYLGIRSGGDYQRRPARVHWTT
jgi:alpha-tubulin suppressor-like RCC1 family protein